MTSYHTKIYFSHINFSKNTFYFLYSNYYKSSGFSTNISRNVWLWYTGWSKSLCAPDDYNTIVRCTETFWSPCTCVFLSQLIWRISMWPREDKSIMWLLESRWLCIPGIYIYIYIYIYYWPVNSGGTLNTSSVTWQHQHLCLLHPTYSARSGSSHMTALHNILTVCMGLYKQHLANIIMKFQVP